MKKYLTHRLVKSEDLNHHGTLYAGRIAEWFVESGFIAAASLLEPKSIICLKVHGMTFLHPVRPGQVICYSSQIADTGKTSLQVYVKAYLAGHEETIYIEDFITFIHVSHETKPQAHGIVIIPETEEGKQLQIRAKALKKN